MFCNRFRIEHRHRTTTQKQIAIDVKMAHPPKRMCIASTPSVTTINDLNDHVLREIFEYLTNLELCDIADVCSNFKRNAQAEFALRNKTSQIVVANENHVIENVFPLQCTPALFRNFGSSISSLEIDINGGVEKSEQVMEVMIQYSETLATLNELSLKDVLFTPRVVPKLQRLLLRLQVLKIWYYTDVWAWIPKSLQTELFSYCSELRALVLMGHSITLCNTRVSFPILRSFYVRDSNRIENDVVENLLKTSPQLKEIHFVKCNNIHDETLVQSIAQYTPDIELISIKKSSVVILGNYVHNTEPWRQLTKLKSLHWYCEGTSFSPILKEIVASQIPLECFQLSSFRSDAEFVRGIVELKRLKKIKFVSAMKMALSDILEIVSNLCELTELTVIYSYCLTITDLPEVLRRGPKLQKIQCEITMQAVITFDDNLFIEIRDMIAARDEKLPLNLELVCQFPHEELHPNVSGKLLNANEDIFRITAYFVDLPYHHDIQFL